MYKTKLFYGLHVEVEKEMNDWFEKNKNIEIKHFSHRTDNLSICIIYKEQKDIPYTYFPIGNEEVEIRLM